MTGGEASPVGRTRTAPDGSPEQVRFAFASCQNYEHGYYTTLRHLASEDVDFIVHLGDYIYEKRFGDEYVREHEMGEVVTLDEYRGRYTTYRMDPALQGRASRGAVDRHDRRSRGRQQLRGQRSRGRPNRRAAHATPGGGVIKPSTEFMPLRRSSMPTGLDMPLYRRLRFGDLIDMSVLDTRQYRSDQPCGDRTKAELRPTRFTRPIHPRSGAACVAARGPGRFAGPLERPRPNRSWSRGYADGRRKAKRPGPWTSGTATPRSGRS